MPSIVTQNTFEGYTLADARLKMLRKLRVNDTVRYSVTKGTADYGWIDDTLNVAQRTFAVRTKCLKTYAIIQLKANYRTYRAPRGFIDISAAYYFNNADSEGYEQLRVASVAELNDEFADWRTAVGSDAEIIYIDRFHGMDAVIGVYPIPSGDGATTSFTSDSGAEYEWACPLYANSPDYGIIIKSDGTDTFILSNADKSVVSDMDVGTGNIFMEYFRLPLDLVEPDQVIEMPYAFQDMIIEEAVRELLENNPEDSVEFKKASAIEQRQERQFAKYDKDMKTPMTARVIKARTTVEGYTKNMSWRGSF
jgi:hypothetical protein